MQKIEFSYFIEYVLNNNKQRDIRLLLINSNGDKQELFGDDIRKYLEENSFLFGKKNIEDILDHFRYL